MPAAEAFVSLAHLLRAQGSASTHAQTPASARDGDEPRLASSAPASAFHAQSAAMRLPASVLDLPEQPAPAPLTLNAAQADAATVHARPSHPETVPPAAAGEAPATAAMTIAEGPALLREIRLFRSALADAFDELRSGLARELAVEVLGRELQLAPADVASIARRLVAERLADEPIRVRVAPSEADFACDLPVVADARLNAGDVLLECRCGAIDARLRVRVDGVLAALTS